MFWVFLLILGLALIISTMVDEESPNLTPTEEELETMVMIELWDDEEW